MSEAFDRRQDDWYRKALLDVLNTLLEENRRATRWRFAFKALSAVFFLCMSGLFLFALGNHLYVISNPHVALVRISGIISPQTDANADRIVTGLRRAFDAGKAKAVLISINSPGGNPVQAEVVHDEILHLKRLHPDKKVIAAIEDMGASAAYYIAAAADEIYANRASVVGSIGVRMSSFGFTKAMERLGIERRLYVSGKYKGLLDMFSDPDPEALNQLKETLKSVHRQFIQVVKASRGKRLKEDPLLFSGLFWNGEEALGLGLIDGLKNRYQIARDITEDGTIVDYTPPVDFFKKLEQDSAGVAKVLYRMLAHPSFL